MSEGDESALVRELRALAGARDDLGNPVIQRNGLSIRVEYAGGSSRSLALSARYDAVARREVPVGDGSAYRDRRLGPLRARRPLAIVLRPETPVDVEAKRSGLSAEWQAGDPAFDDRVYVSTVTEDSRVLDAVLVPELRAGVLQLFDLGFRSVTIDGEDRLVVAQVTEFASREPRDGRGPRAVDAFARVLGALPAIRAIGRTDDRAPYTRLTLAMKVVGIVGWGLNVGYVAGLAELIPDVFPWMRPPRQDGIAVVCVAGLVAGIAAGVVLSGSYAVAVGNAVRGTSRAHELQEEARWASFGAISVAAFTVVFLVGVALASR